MPLRPGISLTTPLAETGVVPARQADLLATLGLTNVGRLIAHLPMRHERIADESTIDQLKPAILGSARGEVVAVRPVRGARPRLEAVLMDHSGRLDVVWFNMMFLHEKVVPGVRVRVHGKPQRRGPGIQMVNPKLEVLSFEKEEPTESQGRLRPVYPASEQINSAAIERVIQKVLPAALPLLEDHLQGQFRKDRDLPSLAEAYRMQHAPRDPGGEHEVLQSRRRLAYDELLLLQLGVQMKRVQLRALHTSPALKVSPEVDARIRARFPFTLTKGQESVVEDLKRDLASATPTNRLIQGDVGSGKTLVALYAMLLAVASTQQASLMAPTEILAEQHYASISRLLEKTRTRVELLTGSTPAADRDRILTSLADGTTDILIGTHALLTDDVKFKSLAVAVIDEQHRFGVSQRATLRAQATQSNASSGATTPHILVMTATPIPRSLALTLFGDLDISVIDGLPPGRQPITTKVLSSQARRAAYADLAARIEQGQQGYIVVPAVDPTTDSTTSAPLVDVKTVQSALETTYLPGKRTAILHAQLPRATREAVMERFRSGVIDALVATTVIEVGVDVPNATIMIVEQADRFGLAQLHQLRGRVGRGGTSSACYLIADPVTPEGQARLAVMEHTTDGFALAEKDLEIRGMGEVFGVKQSGLPPFKVADPTRDRELLNLAGRDAQSWIAKSPRLDRADESVLKRRLMRTHGQFLGLADVG
ncbi:MAG TPA: ATP-dependent DNA helicase RecG [Phycisphaerales bacterium]|nr:ATP-dependent DNA helicase RecG [Phycisphaerales bacterium]